MKSTSKKDALLREINKFQKKGLFRTLFFVGLVILGVFIFREVLVFALKTEYPLQTPISRSMEPTLKVGDLLIVQGGISGGDIHADPNNGDIIVFRKPGNPEELIVHRAIEKFRIDDEWYFKTKGDGNSGPDLWRISEDYLIGKVIWSFPFLGYVKIYLGTPLGMIINILLLLALLFLENATSSERTESSTKTEETKEEEEKTQE